MMEPEKVISLANLIIGHMVTSRATAHPSGGVELTPTQAEEIEQAARDLVSMARRAKTGA